MKYLLSLLITLSLCTTLSAQQQTGDPRSKSIFALPEFREAKILQPFGRFTRAKANILLKNGALCFMKGDTIMQADVSRILGVQFDTLEYKRVDNTQMGRVVSQKGYYYLLAVTTINMPKYRAETEGGDNMPFLEITDTGYFQELDGEAFEYDKGFPLTTKYYFNLKGVIIPANETSFKQHIRPEMRTAFRRLMNDKFWSWNDPASLTLLFTYLPE